LTINTDYDSHSDSTNFGINHNFFSLISRMKILILQINFPSKYGKSGTPQNIFSDLVQEKQRSKRDCPR
jgi:hypothetical protein